MAMDVGALMATIFGSGVQGFAKGIEQRQQDAFKARALDIEKQRADQLVEMQQAKLAQEQQQFEAGQFTSPADLAALAGVGIKLPPELLTQGRIKTSLIAPILTRAAEQEKIRREQEIYNRQADVLERQGAGSPGTPGIPARPSPFGDELPPDQGPQIPGRPSEGADMVPGRAARPAIPELQALASLLRAGAPIPPQVDKAIDREYGMQRTLDTIKQVQQQQQGGDGRRVQMVPEIGAGGALSFKGSAEPDNWLAARRALAEQGWQEGMPGYNIEFKAQIDQPVPLAQGGKATTRAETIQPPSFYAPGGGGYSLVQGGGGGRGLVPTPTGPPGAPPAPGAPRSRVPSRYEGDEKPLPDSTAKDIITANTMRRAANKITAVLRDPIVDQYIGPYAQYTDWAQGKIPFELGGKIPPAIIDLDQSLNTLHNYTIRLLTGAQMSENEAARIKGALPQRGNQVDEFKQRMKNTLDDIDMMENKLRSLVLTGDQKARQAAQDLGLSELPDTRLSPGQKPPPGYDAESAPPPGAPRLTMEPRLNEGPGVVRVRDPRTGRTGRVPPGEQVPAGVEVLR
jgi:hypothetical protein